MKLKWSELKQCTSILWDSHFLASYRSNVPIYMLGLYTSGICNISRMGIACLLAIPSGHEGIYNLFLWCICPGSGICAAYQNRARNSSLLGMLSGCIGRTLRARDLKSKNSVRTVLHPVGQFSTL